MKRLYLIILMALCCVGCKQASKNEVSFQEISSFFEDSQNISAQQKNILLIFSSKSCQYCNKLNAQIKNTPALSKLIKDAFSSYHINLSEKKSYTFGEHSSGELSTQELASLYQVTSTPTLIFLNQAGNVMLKYTGFIDAPRLIATMEFLRSDEASKMSENEIAKNLLKLYHQKKI